MSGSKIYKLSTSSPIANLAMYFTETILGDEYAGKIGDYILEMQTGKTPPMNIPKYYSSDEINWAKPSDIGKGKYLVDLPDKLSQIAVDENKVTLYKPGTLLIICIGAGVGRVALTNNLISSNQQITGILFDKNVLPEYAYYYFFCREAVFKQNASQTTLPIINQKGLKDLDFRCPDKDLQKAFLDYVHYCENCLSKEELPLDRSFDLPDILFDTTKKYFVIYYAQNNILTELDQQQTYLQFLRQTILQEAVQGKLTKQDPTDEPATELLKRIKAEKEKLIKAGKLKKEKELSPITEDEIPFELPEGWVWCRLGEIVSLITKGSSPKWQGVEYVEEGLLFVTSENVDSYKIDLSKKKFVQWKFNEIEPRSILKKGDYLMNIVGGSIVRTAIYDLDEVANINQAVCLIRKETDLLSSEYLLHFFNSSICIGYMFDKQVDNARPNLSMGNIARFLIPLPPLAEQQRIVAKVQQLQQQLSQLEAQVQQSRQYAQQLLQSVLKEAFEQKGEVFEENELLT